MWKKDTTKLAPAHEVNGINIIGLSTTLTDHLFINSRKEKFPITHTFRLNVVTKLGGMYGSDSTTIRENPFPVPSFKGSNFHATIELCNGTLYAFEFKRSES
jgi:hypothetical protein